MVREVGHRASDKSTLMKQQCYGRGTAIVVERSGRPCGKKHVCQCGWAFGRSWRRGCTYKHRSRCPLRQTKTKTKNKKVTRSATEKARWHDRGVDGFLGRSRWQSASSIVVQCNRDNCLVWACFQILNWRSSCRCYWQRK